MACCKTSGTAICSYWHQCYREGREGSSYMSRLVAYMRWEYTLSILFLKAFSEDAPTTLSGREFHAFVTLLEKKYLYFFGIRADFG